jgi:predicted nucleotidyltransferase component of viral defense system
MKVSSLNSFRLVGGTALSLLRGHRMSEDIDLFASVEYGTIDFKSIENEIQRLFPVVVNDDDILGIHLENHMGLHLHIGLGENPSVKADILNWSAAEFIHPAFEIEDIRFATVEEIALMKLDTISRGGRKKDFWDMSEIFDTHELKDLLELYPVKYPYNEVQDVIKGMTNFQLADEVPDPICLKQKYWDLIKMEMQQAVALL